LNVRKLSFLLLLAGCVTSSPLVKGPVNPTRDRLEALPRCAPGAEPGVLTVRATTCTRMHCQEACCNQCSWEASFEKNGKPSPVEAAQVEALLGVTGSALDCEIAAWGEALSGLSVSVDPGCVAR
jgi:hypothetical protein